MIIFFALNSHCLRYERRTGDLVRHSHYIRLPLHSPLERRSFGRIYVSSKLRSVSACELGEDASSHSDRLDRRVTTPLYYSYDSLDDLSVTPDLYASSSSVTHVVRKMCRLYSSSRVSRGNQRPSDTPTAQLKVA